MKPLLLLSAFAAFAFAFPAPAAEKAAGPNIVYILTDDLGYGDVAGLNPQSKIKTPQLDRLAAGGMVFTEAHSSSAVCTPSRYNILTGRYNWRSTLKQNVLGGFSPPLIEEGRLTVADLLRREGYATSYVGKWHLGLDWARVKGRGFTNENAGAGIDFTKPFGRGPTTLGFQEFFGISASLDMPPYVFLKNDRVTELPSIPNGSVTDHKGKRMRAGPTAPGFKAVDVLPTLTQRAVEAIDRHAAGARQGRPFFLYLALPTPHTPIAPTPEWIGKSGLNFYADYVMESDACVGDVLAALERNGLAGDTLVIFTSDNGCSPEADIPYLTSHGHDPSCGRRGYKADIFDGGHRIPFIVRWPARIAAGSTNHDFVCLGDFMATCADLLKVKLPANAGEDSVSFLPLISGGTPARDTIVGHSINGSFCIRQGRWKLALCADSGGWSAPRPGRDQPKEMPRFQLFDVVDDPAEKTNVQDQHPDAVQRLGKLMREYVLNGRSTPGAPQKNAAVKSWPQTAWVEEFK